MSPKTEACCPFMATLRDNEPYHGCHITLEEGKLASCDDDGNRLPPLNFCPWCRKEIAQYVLPSSK